MSFWSELLAVGEPEQEQLRKWRAIGHPLPYRAKPQWVLRQRPTSLGLFKLPLAVSTESNFNAITVPLVCWALCLVGLLLLGFALGQSDSEEAMFLLWFGVAVCFATAAVLWNDHRFHGRFGPETASLQLRPGDTLLLMLRKPPGTTQLDDARLVYRERWYVNSNDNTYWKQEELQSMPIHFQHTDAQLLTAHISLPADLPASYDAGEYRLEWAVAIDLVPWWGFPRTSYYILWIAP